jgi:putative transcriptional regulator
MSKLGKRMIKAMDEAIAIAKGEADPSTYRVHVPSSIDVRAVRLKLKMTQPSSPAGLGLSSQRSGDWEQNRRTPEGQPRPLDHHRARARGRGASLSNSLRYSPTANFLRPPPSLPRNLKARRNARS